MAKSQNIGFRISNHHFEIATEKAAERGYRSPHEMARSQFLNVIDANHCLSSLILENGQSLQRQQQILVKGLIRILACVDKDDALIQDFLALLK